MQTQTRYSAAQGNTIFTQLCGGKVKYGSVSYAMQAAPKDSGRFYSYKCKDCGLFHIAEKWINAPAIMNALAPEMVDESDFEGDEYPRYERER